MTLSSCPPHLGHRIRFRLATQPAAVQHGLNHNPLGRQWKTLKSSSADAPSERRLLNPSPHSEGLSLNHWQ